MNCFKAVAKLGFFSGFCTSACPIFRHLTEDLTLPKKKTESEEIDPVEIPINGELDLHMFRPSEVKGLLADYFEACMEKGITSVRVIHGKGTGTLRETVHALLKKSARVERFRLGDESSGSWGATLVRLKKPES